MDNTITTNWLNGESPYVFYTGDAVTFNDTGSNTPAINLVGNLTPGSIAVNAALDYTFAGTGGISGPGTLTKQRCRHSDPQEYQLLSRLDHGKRTGDHERATRSPMPARCRWTAAPRSR